MTDTSNSSPLPHLDPSIIVIYGITGDLSQRYLLPALYHLLMQGLLHEKTEIIGISRQDISVDDLLDKTKLCITEESGVCDPDAFNKMRQHTRMFQMAPTDKEAYVRLHQLLDQIEAEQGVCMNRLYYLSIPPQVYGPIINLMDETGFEHPAAPTVPAMTRLLVEKPFGYDSNSAHDLITETGKVFGEQQMFRIDHYLAKETVQNILTFRFQNPIFEAIWNNQHISSIDISASEKIGIEGRANFYEPIGALRDFIQSHLMQVLAVVTMDQPDVMDSEHIHARKQALLDQVRTIPADKVNQRAYRARYQGYLEEVKNPDSHTETFAAIRIYIESERWGNVPITLWTGKSLDDKKTEVKISFTGQGEQPNELRFRIQPNEGIELDLLTKKPGYETELQTAAMDFSYQTSFAQHDHPNAYERVLVDAVRGDHTLFATSDEVLAAWRIVQPVLDEWAKTNAMAEYPAGTKGGSLIANLEDS